MTAAGRDLAVVRREAARAAHIVRNLLSFVRQSTTDRAVADLNDIAQTGLELRAYHLERNDMRIHLVRHDGPLRVRINREEILQIVLNLILNAEQALEGTGTGGTITLRTFTVGGQHGLDISDDGPGVSPELRGRIFEPFFTTKDVGQGTGLGLSISHGIALAHGGTLELCDRAHGACFRLLLPADAQVDVAGARPAVMASGLALVVDDEAPVRQLLARLLERRGFDVVEADSGESAVAIARERHPRIVVCDIRMPGMSGIDVFHEVTAALPELRGRFVLVSGDGGQADSAGAAVLAKPFTASDLDAVLASIAPLA
jgi:CheY-like chemotaxis protein